MIIEKQANIEDGQRGQHVQNRRLQIRKLNVENKCAIIYYCILKRTWPLRMIALSSAN